MPKHELVGFEMSTSGRDDGTVEAVYIQFSTDPVHRTKEIHEDTVLADYSADGKLVGIEIIAPIRFAELEKLIDEQPKREPIRRFIQRSAPRDLVLA
ncbi:MAG TPA: DUF2283 domain-containing protein [Tepidisphaeraceae bacterium]|nr:DUF2283 domain-containing protein [Tepidisphaeraceae bacterium]